MIDTSWTATKAQAEQQRTIHRIRTEAEIVVMLQRAELAGFDAEGFKRLEYVRRLALAGKIEG